MPPWTTWTPPTCGPRCWCEVPQVGHLIAEPVNTGTNAAFILVALWIMRRPAPDAAHRAWRDAFAAATAFVGLGSIALHATNTLAGQVLDIASMFVVLGLILAHDAWRTGWLSPRRLTAVAAGTLVLTFAGLGTAWSWRREIFTAGVVAVLASTVLARRHLGRGDLGPMVGAAVSMSAARGLWSLEQAGVWCQPGALLSGHGVWHLGCALALGLLYRHLETARAPVRVPQEDWVPRPSLELSPSTVDGP